MKLWFYKAVAEDGRELTGTLEAPAPMTAYTMLRERGLKPLRVCETGLPGPEQQSYDCLNFGIISLLPLVGVFAAWKAMQLFRETTVSHSRNSLQVYLYAGFLIAWFGWPVSVLLTVPALMGLVYGISGWFHPLH